MTMTPLVSLDGSYQSTGQLAAFVGAEVRGVSGSPSAIPFGPHQGKHSFDMMIYANTNGETLGFKFKMASGTVSNLDQTKTFQEYAHLGHLFDPVIFTGTMPAAPAASPPPAPSCSTCTHVGYHGGPPLFQLSWYSAAVWPDGVAGCQVPKGTISALMSTSTSWE